MPLTWTAVPGGALDGRSVNTGPVISNLDPLIVRLADAQNNFVS